MLNYETVYDLIGKRLRVTIELKKADNIPDKLSNHVYAQYTWIDEDKQEFKSDVCE